jgi:hypothetical protein
MKKPGETFSVLAMMLVLAAAVYWQVFTSRRLPGGQLSDTVHQGYPFLAFTESSLQQGRLPLWNPYIFGGVPFYASFSSPVFYPLRGLPLILFGAEASVRFLYPVHMFLAGLFAWLFLRASGVSGPGRFAGAAAYSLGAWANTLFYAGHGSKVICWAMLPLLLFAVRRWADSGKPRWIGLGALAVGMQGLSSHPQMMLYSGIMAGVLTVWLLGRPRTWPSGIAGPGAMMVLGVLTAAVQLYPGYLFSRNSTRGEGLDPATASSYSMPPEESLTMILPSAFGLRHGFPDSSISGVPVYFGRLGLRLSSEFIGVTVFILAVAGLAAGSDRRLRGGLITLAVLGTVISWGGYTGLFGILYRAVPVFRQIRAPHMAAFITTSSLALAAGFGFDALFSKSASKRTTAAIAGAAALFMVLIPLAEPLSRALQNSWWTRMGAPGAEGFGHIVKHRADLLRSDLFRAFLSSAGLLALVAGFRKYRMGAVPAAAGVVLITAFELVPFNRSFQVYLNQTSLESLFPGNPGLEAMAGPGRVFPGGNDLVPLGIRSAGGYHAARPALVDSMTEIMVSPTPETVYQFAVTAFSMPEGVFSWNDFHDAVSGEYPGLPGEPMPRAFIPTQPVSGTSEQGFDAVSRGVNPMVISVIDAPAAEVPLACSGDARIILDDPEEVVIRVSTGSPAVLVLADTWYPRWSARVNGVPAQVRRANGWMRSVLLPPGESVVRFHYDGSDVKTGLWVSLGAAALAVLMAALPERKRRIG